MTEDTIAAIATASGRAGLAIVRVSGPEARSIARGLGFETLEPRRATYGGVRHPESGTVVDRAVVTWFAGPASYTGEDVIELACHGGHLAPRLVLDAALAAGARSAERGEFTRRAFLNGKLDLVQVEATLDLVEARTEALGRAAMRQLEGGLSRRVDRLRERLVRLQAMLGYEIDFPEEDEGPIPPERIERAAASLAEELDGLLRHAPEGELLREGALTVIAGRPNAGKSSLFNALVGSPRAIVTELAGTTRDAVEALVSIEGYPFRLVDTAGLRAGPGYVERIGIEVARGYLERADLVLLCADAGRRLEPAEEELLARWRRERREILTVRTKADLAGPDGDSPVGEPPGAVRASVRTGEGLERIREALVARVFAGLRTAGEAPFLVRRRQVRAVREARGQVEAFQEARRTGLPPEISAVHLRDAASALEALLGAVDQEEILEALFRSFCVGK